MRGPNLTRHEKLTLAKLYNTYSAEYTHGNWGKFWIKMGRKLKEATGREQKTVPNIVEQWIKIWQTELFKQEMESGTEEKRNGFMEAVDRFTECWKHSRDQVAKKVTGKKTKRKENQNVQRARYNIMIGNAADEAIEVEDDNSPDANAPPPTNKKKKGPTAEDKIAESFSRIADYLISSDDKGHQKKRGRKRQKSGSGGEDSGEKRGRKKSNSTARIQTEMMVKLMTKMMEMSETLLKVTQRLENIEENSP